MEKLVNVVAVADEDYIKLLSRSSIDDSVISDSNSVDILKSLQLLFSGDSRIFPDISDFISDGNLIKFRKFLELFFRPRGNDNRHILSSEATFSKFLPFLKSVFFTASLSM